jgi:hypothetical protein
MNKGGAVKEEGKKDKSAAKHKKNYSKADDDMSE